MASTPDLKSVVEDEMLRDYFKNGRYEPALKAYARFAREEDWQMSYRAELYAYAQTAFGGQASAELRRQAFEKIYAGVSKYKGFRNATGGHWDADQIIAVLTDTCKPAGRDIGRNLASLKSVKDVNAIEDAISDLAGIKTIGEYPHMVASKFLHFFNPYLFPMYDKKIIWDKVLCGSFKGEWQGVCDRTGIKFYERSGAFNVSYTQWAAANIQASGPELMLHFAEWFRTEARISADDLPNLELYYATAFEFIAIGAIVTITGGV